jgi:hypothetical protein
MTHTPGPWASDPTVSFHDRPDLPCVVDEHRLIVAQCWDDGHSEDECEANARLIAAAPELYEALRMCLLNGNLEEQERDMGLAALAKATSSTRGRGAAEKAAPEAST